MDVPTLAIDLDAIADNWRTMRAHHPSGPVAAVVKADAYGLGAAQVAGKLFADGCRHFFVATASEALAVRATIPGAMLAVLNGLTPDAQHALSAHDILPVLGSLAEIDAWSAHARALGRDLPALLHIDTGMNRLGLDAAELAALSDDHARLDGVALRYVMTHFIAADAFDDPLTQRQLARFAAACERLPPAPRSVANSGGGLIGAASDLARPGGALYGLNPLEGVPNPMRPVVTLTAPVIAVRTIAAGETVGYSGTWTAARTSRIATIGVGYADGWHRARSNRGGARFDGRPVPLVGRVSMDLTTFDVTDLPAIGPGARLTLIGPDCSPDDVAEAAGTTGYEVLTALGRRYARIYIGA